MNTHDSFPQFSRLPLELRRLVWLHCLPRRIAEEDIPYTLLDGKNCRQACWPNRTTFQNARVPLIASVSHEARQTVFQWGRDQKSQDASSLHKIWIQPEIDEALHINWTRRRNLAYYQVHNAYIPEDDETPLLFFMYRARWNYGMRISLVGDVICSFDVERLIAANTTTTTAADGPPPSDSESVAFEPTGLSISDSSFERELDLRDIMELAQDQTVDLTLVAISLHVNKATALASGLFGLLGDAPVQTVNFDDTARLRQFYQLYSSDTTLKQSEPHVDKLFNAILSPQFQTAVQSWERQARRLLQATTRVWMLRWKPQSFEDVSPESGGGFPVLNTQRGMRMDAYDADRCSTQWWDYANGLTLKLVPRVMVRLCDNQCYKSERRPEKFGDVWFGVYS